MIKRGIYIFSILAVIFLVWYFFVKSADYTINFKSNTFPETIIQSLKLWNNGLDNSVELGKVDNYVQQTIQITDSTHIYNWQIKSLTDTSSQVTVGVSDQNLINSLKNKLLVPFSKTDFSNGSEKRVFNFMTVLKDHVDNFKITIIGIEEIPEKFLAFIPIKKTQVEKARGMMENSSFIGEILLKNGVELNGPPMLEVTEWNRSKDSISYNFGYPILPQQNLPTTTEIQYKKLETTKGIKAIYNGNYITSDRAWYALLRYAKTNGLNVAPNPIEIFYNNPDMGGNSLNWKTEVYLPLIDE